MPDLPFGLIGSMFMAILKFFRWLLRPEYDEFEGDFEPFTAEPVEYCDCCEGQFRVSDKEITRCEFCPECLCPFCLQPDVHHCNASLLLYEHGM